MIPRRSSNVALGGRPQQFRSKDLHQLLLASDFNPSKAGNEWALIITDTHSNKDWVYGTIDERFLPTLELLALNPPDQVLHIGDVLTHYVEWGFPPNPAIGAGDIQRSNALLERFARIAPLKIVLGNHDCHVGEEPLGKFMMENCRFFNELHYSFELGGARIIMLSTTHDGDIIPSELEYLAAQLMLVSPGQDIVLMAHQPGNSRTVDWALQNKLSAALSGVTNRLWYICGHDHDYGDARHPLALTDMQRWKVGAGTGPWVHFGPDYLPTMAAVTFSGGKLQRRYAWSGVDRMWYEYPEFNQPAPTPLRQMLSGLSAFTVLSSHFHGSFTLSDHIDNAPGATTYYDNGTWLVYCNDVKIHFPLPPTATKFFYIASTKASAIDLSADGSVWTSVAVPNDIDNAFIVTVPAPLLSASTIYARVRGAGIVSAWGFAK